MEQTKALNALEPFLALSKSATSPRAAADLVIRATSSPNTFIFSELLSTPQIQSLSSSTEYVNHLTLLQIFSYGTYTSYTSTPGLPTLNDAQLLKLRQLSFLTLARNSADLSYSNLLTSLGMSTPRELEDLVISAIYAGLVSATLDPYHQNVLVSSVSPLRDLEPNSIPSMLDTLSEWSSRCTSTLADLERQIAGIKAEAARRHKEEAEWSAEVEKITDDKIKGDAAKGPLNNFMSSITGGLGMGRKLGGGQGKRGMADGDAWEDDMDLDEEDDDIPHRNTRAAKKRGFGGLGGGK
ncbi:hypothetical protein GLAREA_08428 [Glarea lozoyensis ATCC 20868]|uniref:PCI domain-containing protein n=1 Tax=Glarea lozoyensis (strain ATCC 20868 / MF5171) TaxID=1116229 RepID=S3CXL3_GLAL2|nr:uncharacterized protein GLAREA_08428 [Glarea lozoyensis ATCC 20868]EPE24576.1 hypothetical protein GLAREA_08428 [Glarea lozoyensis ATCC 20868]